MRTTYEPIDVLKPVGPECWIVDGPVIRFYCMPFSTRMTVVRLADGSLWLHSPVRLTADLAAEVSALGPVRHLIAPNWLHYAYINDWAEVFPEAKVHAAPGAAERAARHGVALRVDQALEEGMPWRGEIDGMIVEGSPVHREVVFLHRASRTLILTDLIENFEPARLPWWFAALARLVGVADPDGKMPRDMALTFWRGRDRLRAAVLQMLAWTPDQVIVAHGRWYDRDGVAELRRAFRRVL